jgi:hypothetical protein
MATQRQILRLVNCKEDQKEELFGLSSKAIERWATVNAIGPNSKLVSLIKTVLENYFSWQTRVRSKFPRITELRHVKLKS